MNEIPPFSAEHLEIASNILADKDRGLSTQEIERIFVDCLLEDVSPEKTCWKRVFNALAKAQNTHHVGNHLIMFINRALDPETYAKDKEKFVWRRGELNMILSFSELSIMDDGKVTRAKVEESDMKDAYARSDALRTALEVRGAHPEILIHCRAELLEENYSHVVFEAIRSVEERVRKLSNLTADGTGLVNTAFSVKAPILAINTLKTEAEVSEQMGFGNILAGLLGVVSDPAAEDSDIMWPMKEQDALDILSLLSFVHRKLDGAVKI